MRHLIAALLVCVATAVAHGRSILDPTGFATSSSKSSKHVGAAPARSGRKELPPATEGQNFYNSFIGPKGPFVWIQPGTFQMGSTSGTDPDRESDETLHTVTLTRGFWLLDHEVTQAEYYSVMESSLNCHWKGPDLPVESITWDQARAFCEKLTVRDRALGKIRADQAYRLPTEAEWEYAARAGTTGARYTVRGKSTKDSLDLIAWWNGNSSNRTHTVKTKEPNAWGLYDMIGNVWEWCGDWYGDYPTGSVTDPTGPGSGRLRVDRGGNWFFGASLARSASRHMNDPGRGNYVLGFRPALSSVR